MGRAGCGRRSRSWRWRTAGSGRRPTTTPPRPPRTTSPPPTPTPTTDPAPPSPRPAVCGRADAPGTAAGPALGPVGASRRPRRHAPPPAGRSAGPARERPGAAGRTAAARAGLVHDLRRARGPEVPCAVARASASHRAGGAAPVSAAPRGRRGRRGCYQPACGLTRALSVPVLVARVSRAWLKGIRVSLIRRKPPAPLTRGTPPPPHPRNCGDIKSHATAPPSGRRAGTRRKT